jgi:hypothetical protein
MTAAMGSKITAGYLCDTLSADKLLELETKLQSRSFSSTGFLKAGQTLKSVVDLDTAALAERGITYQQIADKLYGIMKRLIKLHNDDADQTTHVTHKAFELEGKFHVVMTSYYRGLQECPFEHALERCDTGFSCCEFAVTNLSQNKSIYFGGLLPHLFAEHEFAEGPGCHHRLDPVEAASVLELEPTVSYTPSVETKRCWHMVDMATSEISDYITWDRSFLSASLLKDTSLDGRAERYILKVDEEGKPSENLFMHVFAHPGTKFDFSAFEDVGMNKGQSFYWEHVRSFTHFTFSLITFDTVILDARDKVVKSRGFMGYSRAGILALHPHVRGVESSTGAASSAASASGGGGGGASACAPLSQVKSTEEAKEE